MDLESMKQDIYLRDYLSSRVIMQNKELGTYGKVYYRINEKIVDDLLSLDISEKDVLSVLASSDQVFMFRGLGANRVDTFDYNRLTIYYYYLRKWSIKYMNSLYPKVLDNNNWLKRLLSLVKPESEEEKKALNFFKMHLKNDSNLSNLFYSLNNEQEGESLFSSVKQIRPYVDDRLVFYEMNLFENSDSFNTYDIIYISNILEWARGDFLKLRVAKDNLLKLLNNNGIVICTKLVNRNNSIVLGEKEIFNEDFIYNDFPDKRGYIYIKR